MNDDQMKILQMAIVTQGELNNTILEAMRENMLLIQRVLTMIENEAVR